MAKKNWIYIKRGLSEDAKHRAAMGECIWLFLHIIDRADWEMGIAYDWKDEQEAADMGMPVRTLREQRRKLDELNYISCKQRQYGQDIIIKNWTNPRDYSGKVLNQGGSETEPEGYTQGYTQGSSQDVTPTSDSLSKSINDSQETKNTAYRRGEQEAPDKIAAMLEMANFPGAKIQARIDSILSYLGAALQRNTETKDWKEFAKYVDSEKQTKGWDVKVFVAWMKKQKGYDPAYWSCRRMREFYTMAFIQDEPKQDWQDRSHAL